MKFSEILNNYIKELNCTAKELAEASDLSNAVISRYRSGEREPTIDSKQVIQIVKGIVDIANNKNISGVSEQKVMSDFHTALTQKTQEFNSFSKNFATLIDILQISMKELSAYTNFEISHLYRIRSGQRKPNNLETFIDSLCQFVFLHYNDTENKQKLAALINVSMDKMSDKASFIHLLKDWFRTADSMEEDNLSDQMGSFLKKLDEFDLDEYIRSIHFDELKVPTLPFYKAMNKQYYGVSEMKKGELDFFKATVLSKSMENVFMCSDMPMVDMAEDMDFNKKWMFGIAMSLKKGLHLDIIHNIDRPFEEMMLGLEAWIPIYMTGQISPYHLPDIKTNIYHHFNYVSGSVALTGECIDGYHNNGKYSLTSNKDEVAYYRQKSKDLLTKAEPLMEIYRSDSKKKFSTFEKSFLGEAGNRHHMLSAPPIYTLSEELLEKVLCNSNVNEADKKEIIEYMQSQASMTEQLLTNQVIFDEIAHVSKEEFEKHPAALSLSGLFKEAEILYTYDNYLEHIELTKKYQESHKNYSVLISDNLAFRNIQVRILENKCVVISKEKAPSIHFVIRHPKMLYALSNFSPAIME